MFAPLLLCCLPLTDTPAAFGTPADAAPADEWWGAAAAAPEGLPRGEVSRATFAEFLAADPGGPDGRRVALALLIAATADPGGDAASAYRVAGFADWPNRTLHVTVRRTAGGEPVAGLDVAPDRTRALLGAGPILVIPGRPRLPPFHVKAGPRAGGGRWGMQFGFGGNSDGSGVSAGAWARLRDLLSAAGQRAYLAADVAAGAVPFARDLPGGGVEIGILTPAARTPDLTRHALRFGPDGRCVGGACDGAELTLAYGPAAAIDPPPPDWPVRGEQVVADLGSLWAAAWPRYLAFLAETAADRAD